jgi:hypothetical protein
MFSYHEILFYTNPFKSQKAKKLRIGKLYESLLGSHILRIIFHTMIFIKCLIGIFDSGENPLM